MSKEPKRNVYVGHRYVPKIMGEWDKTESYEGLSIVTNKGTSYTSKKRVPKGIDILNEEYWVVTGNYNAQIEEYRKDVRELEKEVDSKSDITYVDELNENVTAKLTQLSVNINDLGADPTGSTDSTEAIERAINLAGNGGTVLIPKGTFISNLETDCDNINFYFKGKLIPLYEKADYCLKLTGNGNKINGLVGEEIVRTRSFLHVTGNNNEIKNVLINGVEKSSLPNVNYEDRLIYLNGENNILENSETYNGRVGIKIEGKNHIVKNIKSHDNITGIHVEAGSENILLDSLWVWDNNVNDDEGADGILVSQRGTIKSKNIILKNFYVWNNGEHGLYFHADESNVSNGFAWNNEKSGFKFANIKGNVTVSDCIGKDNDIDRVEGTASDFYIQSPVKDLKMFNCFSDGGRNGFKSVLLDDSHEMVIEINNCKAINNISNSFSISGTDGTVIVNNEGEDMSLTASSNRNSIKVINNIVNVLSINRMYNTLFKQNKIKERISTTTNNRLLSFISNDITTDLDIDFRDIYKFNNNEVVFKGESKFRPIAGVSSLKEFQNNNINALELSENYVFNPLGGSNLSGVKFIRNIIELKSDIRAIMFRGEGNMISDNVIIGSSSTRTIDIYDSQSVITGNSAPTGATIYLQPDVAINNIVSLNQIIVEGFESISNNIIANNKE